MGSSKKHKEKDREHKKKKKHKERSRSRSRERRHKEKRHGRSGDYDPSRESKRPKETSMKDEQVSEDDRFADEMLESLPVKSEISSSSRPLKTEVPESDIPGPKSASGDASLSIDETNKLRAKLGLKPLEENSGEGKKSASSQKDDVHVPAVNMSKMRKQKEMKEKLEQAKERRKIKEKLRKVKRLAENDDEDALAWVKRSRKQEQDKIMAEKRAKVLEEMDEEFGIGDLVEEEFGSKKKTNYSSKDLKGLQVQHAQESFKEGKTIILTLKDKGVLDDDEGDTLVNVNIQDDEKAKENIDNRLKKPTYKPYDEAEMDEYGMIKPKEILDKYDEEIDGKKQEKFELGSGGKYDAQHERRMKEIRAEFQQQSQKLVLPAPVIQREFYTEVEMASFNKVKKKVRKIRKKPKMVSADDLLPLDDAMQVDHGSRGKKRQRPQDEGEEGELIDDIKKEADAIPGLDLIGVGLEEAEVLGPDEDLTGVTIDDEAGVELELALNKARRLKGKKEVTVPERFAEHIQAIKQESESEEEEEEAVEEEQMSEAAVARNIFLNQTSEFCRSLGEITNYGQAGNRREDEEDELMDFERELAEERRRREEEEEQNPGWQEVEIDNRPVDITDANEQNILDDEPALNEGMASALELAVKKGYIEKEKKKSSRGGSSNKAQQSEIEALNYSIEDKRYDDLDDKFRKRDRFGGGGMVSDFKEKDDYKPEVMIKYRDDQGRDMCAKEAFRYLSHRFHGKGSGKTKTEKRQKKWEQEQLMKSMTSTDTPLGSAGKLGEKLQKEKTPYIVLSGANKNNPPSLTKT